MTITSNIHVGLAAWSNHTFTAGERCSTGGNAYECTTPGTSTSAPTGTGPDVDNGGAAHFKWLSAIDYTTLQAWSDAITTPLSQPVVGQVWNDGIIQCALGTIILNIDNHVTTTTNTITLTCAPGESFTDRQSTPLAADSTKGVTIRGAASGTPTPVDYVWVSDDNVVIDGIQFVDPYSASQSALMITWNTNLVIRNCIFDGYSSSVAGKHLVNFWTSVAYTVTNCLFIDRATTNVSHAIYCGNTGTTDGNIVNCTVISSVTSAIGIAAAATATNGVQVKNCAIFGSTTLPCAADSTLAALSVDHCVFDATSLGGSATDGGSNLFSRTAANQFISATTDFRLKTGADCINAGTTDTTDLPSADDIFGTPRPLGSAWDVGPFEFGLMIPPSVHGRGPQLQPFLVR